MYSVIIALSFLSAASSTIRPPDQNFNNRTSSEDPTVSYTLYSEEFLNCAKFQFEPHQYQVLEDGSVYVPYYNTTHDSRNHFIHNGTRLYICAPPSPVGSPANRVSQILTFVFLLLSCVCLALHLLIFIVVPEYKTISGKNTASIAACLFIANALFLVGGGLKGTPHCSRIAPAICYFFLSSFFWMNSFVFDVWLSLNTSIKRLYEFVVKTKESTRYLIYSIYSFGVPLVVVGTAGIIDTGVLGYGEFAPVFGKNKCWFLSGKSFIVFFLAPFITLIALDILFFVLSVVALSKLKTSSGKHELSPKRRLVLCSRLAIATGLPWIVAIFAIFIKWHPLDIIFIACTALQGVYIFIAYDCNKKTLKYLRRTLKGTEEGPSTTVVKNASTAV